MSERTYNCLKGCCTIKIADYQPNSIPKKRKGNCRKAGVFIYDPNEDRVLLVQSRGLLWGSPKGTLEMDIDETSLQCAIREVKEETGLTVSAEDFSRVIRIKNRALYYYSEMKTQEVFIQKNYDDNDANGITWIKVDCLEQCIEAGMISLNQHSRLVFKKFMDKTFPKVEFTKVENRRRRSAIEEIVN
jgi:ADP-ribose pyrophosphatase YjhB (NUDIX family)